ncbi:MAG TPA: sigma-70 family RNA polymerase sigma factor [Bryobacteraceae bacterium]|nr:sigma-70 family RNA polymerase sigma factor [Bryobacteraceae bacterium]
MITSEREKRWHVYLEGVAGGNGEALAALYDEASTVLYSLALRILGNAADAEEVLLEVFEQVWRSARTFDPARSGAWRWLTVLARSRSIDRLRASASKRRLEERGFFDCISRDPSPDEASIWRQQQLRIRESLNALPREQREALELAYFSGLTHVEIAAALGEPLGTIKTRIRMGMDKLRVALGRNSRAAAGSTR